MRHDRCQKQKQDRLCNHACVSYEVSGTVIAEAILPRDQLRPVTRAAVAHRHQQCLAIIRRTPGSLYTEEIRDSSMRQMPLMQGHQTPVPSMVLTCRASASASVERMAVSRRRAAMGNRKSSDVSKPLPHTQQTQRQVGKQGVASECGEASCVCNGEEMCEWLDECQTVGAYLRVSTSVCTTE